MSDNDQSLVEVQIDANLKRIFEQDASEELPQRLLDLLDKLDSVDVPEALKSDDASDKGESA